MSAEFSIISDNCLPFMQNQKFLDLALRQIDRQSLFDQSKALSYYKDNKLHLRDAESQGGSKVYAALSESIGAQDELAEFCSQLQGYDLTAPTFESAGIEKLWHLSLKCKEDICILQRSKSDEFRLTAASLCAPSGWDLQSRIGQPLAILHHPVPGLNRDIGDQLDRLLVRMKPNHFYRRCNWSLKLHHSLADFPLQATSQCQPAMLRHKNLPVIQDLSSIFMRVEQQSLWKLPDTGAVIFLILVMVEPLSSIFARTDCQAQLLDSLSRQGSEVRRYKNIERIYRFLIKSTGN